MNFAHAGDELLEKNQKGYFDGVDCGPAERHKCVKNSEWGLEQPLDLIRA
jgi:hypothetical protein